MQNLPALYIFFSFIETQNSCVVRKYVSLIRCWPDIDLFCRTPLKLRSKLENATIIIQNSICNFRFNGQHYAAFAMIHIVVRLKWVLVGLLIFKTNKGNIMWYLFSYPTLFINGVDRCQSITSYIGLYQSDLDGPLHTKWLSWIKKYLIKDGHVCPSSPETNERNIMWIY